MGIMVRDRPAQESALMEPRCGNFLHSGALQPEPEQLPSGWEKCLDLKSGLIYFKDWNSGTMTYRDPRQRLRPRAVWMSESSETTTPSTTASLQITTDDEEQSLELSLNLPGSKKSSGTITALKSSSSKSQEESVCTMEKVRLALDRLSNSTANINNNNKKRSTVSASSRESNSLSSSSECFTSPSVMSYEGDDDEPEVEQQPRRSTATGAPVTKVAVAVAVPEVMGIVGCKSCLMYVMLSKSHPCCPKCGNTDVLLELPEAKPVSKKQRITQLESSTSPTTWSWCTA